MPTPSDSWTQTDRTRPAANGLGIGILNVKIEFADDGEVGFSAWLDQL